MITNQQQLSAGAGEAQDRVSKVHGHYSYSSTPERSSIWPLQLESDQHQPAVSVASSWI